MKKIYNTLVVCTVLGAVLLLTCGAQTPPMKTDNPFFEYGQKNYRTVVALYENMPSEQRSTPEIAYVAGKSYFALGDYDNAVAALVVAATNFWHAHLYARYDYGVAVFHHGDFETAEETFSALADETTNFFIINGITEHRAYIAMSNGNYTTAIRYWKMLQSNYYQCEELFGRRFKRYCFPSSFGLYIYKQLGRCYEAKSDWSSAAAFYHRILRNVSGGERGEDALERLDAVARASGHDYCTAPAELYHRGKNMLRLKRYDEAAACAEKILNRSSLSEYWRYQALCLAFDTHLAAENVSAAKTIAIQLTNLSHRDYRAKGLIKYATCVSRKEALTIYVRIINEFSGTPSYQDACLRLASAALTDKEFALSSEYALRGLRTYPTSKELGRTALMAGLSLYAGTNYEAAAELLNPLTNYNIVAEAAFYWLGRCYEKQGMTDAAASVYRRVLFDWPWTFYFWYALEHYRECAPLGDDEQAEFETEIEKYMRRKKWDKAAEHCLEVIYRIDDDDERDNFIETLHDCLKNMSEYKIFFDTNISAVSNNVLPHFETLDTLFRIREVQYGELELAYALQSYSQSSDAHRLALARYFDSLNLPSRAVRFYEMITWGNNQDPYLRFVSDGFLRGRWRIPYTDYVRASCRRNNNLNSAVVYAVMRQESFYNVYALSYADAHGLMQVIPPTYRYIKTRAAGLRRADDNMYSIYNNIEAGTWYLADQMKTFDNDLILSAAAYNAGPRRPIEWRNKYPHSEPALIVEFIPIHQTRIYCKKVWQNYCMYSIMYPEGI